MGWIEAASMSLKLTNVLWVDETVRVHGRSCDEQREGTATRVHCDVWVEKLDGTRILLATRARLRS